MALPLLEPHLIILLHFYAPWKPPHWLRVITISCGPLLLVKVCSEKFIMENFQTEVQGMLTLMDAYSLACACGILVWMFQNKRKVT